MSNKLFGTFVLCQCLTELGFTSNKAKSSHVKFNPSKDHKIPLGVRPFIIIQLNQKQYDCHECSRYISELVQKGFERKRILQLLNS